MNHLVWVGRLRTVVTLVALVIVVLVAVAWGFDKATAPFPERADTPRCIETEVKVGDTLRPSAIVVSVLNSRGPNGLSFRTRNDLGDRGFSKGDYENAPKDLRVKDVAILTNDRRSPAVKLLRSYLGGKQVKILDRPSTYIGLNVVVGPEFTGVAEGRPSIVANRATTVCTPPALTSGS